MNTNDYNAAFWAVCEFVDFMTGILRVSFTSGGERCISHVTRTDQRVFLPRQDDEVVLQCVACIQKENRKLCLAAEGLGNRLCYLEPTSEAKVGARVKEAFGGTHTHTHANQSSMETKYPHSALACLDPANNERSRAESRLSTSSDHIRCTFLDASSLQGTTVHLCGDNSLQ